MDLDTITTTYRMLAGQLADSRPGSARAVAAERRIADLVAQAERLGMLDQFLAGLHPTR